MPTGIVVSNASQVYYDPVDAKINVVLPSIAVIIYISSNESLQPIMPL